MKKVSVLAKKITSSNVVSGLAFLLSLVVILPLVTEVFFLNTEESVDTTKYIFLGYAVFFLIFVDLLVPLFRKFFSWIRVREFSWFFDSIATLLIVIFSAVPLTLLAIGTVILLNRLIKNGKEREAYKVLYFSASTAAFLLGVWIVSKGKRQPQAKNFIINHTSLLDYLLICIVMGKEPWNAVAGINLFHDRKGLFNKFLAWSIGRLVKEYSISIDRNNPDSRRDVLVRMRAERQKGKNIILAPEGGRTTSSQIKSGKILGEFKPGIFILAWERKEKIQPIIFDFPAAWRGKQDSFWGVHPSKIRIIFMSVIDPLNYDSLESLKESAWEAMYNELCKSKAVRRFVET